VLSEVWGRERSNDDHHRGNMESLLHNERSHLKKLIFAHLMSRSFRLKNSLLDFIKIFPVWESQI
jgi:hypothetical protein